MSNLSIQCLQSLEALHGIETEWVMLYERCTAATVFQSPAWLIPWWRAFAPGELAMFVVREHDQLMGVAPFYLDNIGCLLPVGVGLSDFIDVLILPEAPAHVATALANALGESEATSVELPELHPRAMAAMLPIPQGAELHMHAGSVCPTLKFDTRQQSLCEAVPAHRLQTLRTAWNRARRAGQPSIEVATPQSAAHWLESLYRLHAARWESVGKSGIAADRRVRSFLHEAVPKLIRGNEAALYLLQLDDECLAAQLILQRREAAFSYMTGFAPDARRFSPGAVLLGHAIERALEQGRSEFNFLRGEEDYKYLWGARVVRNSARTFYLHRDASAALSAAHR